MRFPEFSGEWSKDCLNEFLEVQPARNTQGIYSKDDVLSVSGDYGVVNQIQLLGRSFAGKDVSNYHIVRTNEIVYTKSPLKEFPYGIVKTNQGTAGIVSTLYAVYSAKSNTNPKFVEYYFSSKERTNKYFKPIVRIGAKHDMKIGNEEVLRNIVVFPSKQEQNKIQEFLRIIDERIAIQSKIIEEQETLLKSLADRMFSENQYSCGLSELVDIVKGKQVNADTLSEEGDYYVMNGGVAPSGYYSEYNVPAGSISISEGGNSCGYVQFNEKPFWSGGHCYSLRAKSDIVDYKYLYYFLKAKQSDVMALRIGSGLPNIQKKDIEKFTVSFPSMVQQLRYVKVLDAVSDQLDAEKSILVLYHKQKEHLLSEMFI